MKKNSIKEEKGSFFEHSEKDLREDRTGSILLDVIIRIRRTYFYQKYGLYIIGIIIVLLIVSMFMDVDDSLINLGESPQMGIKGASLVALLTYLGIELDFKSKLIGGIILLPFLGFLGVSVIYEQYRTERYNEIMKEKNIVSGIVYGKYVDFGRGYRHNIIKVRYRHNNVYKFEIPVKIDNYQVIDIRDSILILTSREYPQVMEVLKWNPTHEEIERYKVPRKFKSYINGKIEEEEE
ncbi:MAG: hypothetical protein IKQ08_05685 [Paludibacteraceae bacterium]|nr:hypothetical protein [Paludibacteraceae bacterium]